MANPTRNGGLTMRVIGTVATVPTEPRIVNTGPKKDHPKKISEVSLIDADGGIVTLQEWSEANENPDSFKGLEVGTRVEVQVNRPNQYQGTTRAGLVNGKASVKVLAK